MRGETDRTLWLIREAMIFDLHDVMGANIEQVRTKLILPSMLPTVWEGFKEGVQDDV